MVALIPCTDMVEYGNKLSALITAHVRTDHTITFIDCANSISPYLFERDDLQSIKQQLFVARIERLHDLVDAIERLPFDPLFQQSDMLLVSSWASLLADVPVRERTSVRHRVLSVLNRLEQRQHLSIVVLDVNSPWATPYLQSGTLSMAN